MRMRRQNVTIRRSKTHRKGSKQLKYEAQREKKKRTHNCTTSVNVVVARIIYFRRFFVSINLTVEHMERMSKTMEPFRKLTHSDCCMCLCEYTEIPLSRTRPQSQTASNMLNWLLNFKHFITNVKCFFSSIFFSLFSLCMRTMNFVLLILLRTNHFHSICTRKTKVTTKSQEMSEMK